MAKKKFKRRDFIKYGVSSLLLVGCHKGDMGEDVLPSYNHILNDNIKRKKLIIPRLNKGKDVDGVINYDIDVQNSTHQFFDGINTKTYAMNASYLGETIYLKNKSNVSINFTNKLDEAVAIHSHGMHLPAKMDGGPHQQITPNTKWSAKYQVNQKACTNWYHAHLMGKTGEHVYKGLAGLIIIEDKESLALDLPKSYGVDDIPLVLQEKNFTNDGEIDYSPSHREIMNGYHGVFYMANGVIDAYLDLGAKEVRFRILNGSNSTRYKLAFSNGMEFKQIATDNAFLEKPVIMKTLKLSPAERAEIVVDFSNVGDMLKQIELKDLLQNKIFLKINLKTSSLKETKTPEILTTLVKYKKSQAINTRKFTLHGRRGNLYINGASMNMSYINEKMPLNQIEIWEIKNNMPMYHNFHIHATHFMAIERNGEYSQVALNERGYKDTISVPPNESVKFIVKMTDYKDDTSPYMYHCHYLEHEDSGMMGQFTVI
jgi:FtsP/CotA-like multicopper oxidase with cupredoxin domain